MIDFKLIYKKITSKLSLSEEEAFRVWLNESDSHKAYYLKVKARINKEKSLLLKQRRRSLFVKWGAAAFFILLIGLSGYHFFSSQYDSSGTLVNITTTNEDPIAPFNTKATLILGDGSHVKLDKKSNFKNEEVQVQEDRISYFKDSSSISSETLMNTLLVPKGGLFKLMLSDGTQVWVNSASQLQYPVRFSEGKPRKVELIYGEAYFEVSPSSENRGSHFIVEVNGQQIEVLGTHFNVKAYSNDNKQVTSLLEGSVKLTYKGIERFLKPNQRGVVFKDKAIINIESTDVQEDVLWKSGVFAFSDYTLEEIGQVLMRWYDAEIVFSNNDVGKRKFSGVLRKNQNLDQILNILSKSISLKYRRDGKHIEIY